MVSNYGHLQSVPELRGLTTRPWRKKDTLRAQLFFIGPTAARIYGEDNNYFNYCFY